mmetsp:Transcript_8937/g.19699  ORF Transcript_8937/g.19699 Transcript_8937/m.19699 type:complete len:519 (-) Transcript_8937:3079-4635(-)
MAVLSFGSDSRDVDHEEFLEITSSFLSTVFNTNLDSIFNFVRVALSYEELDSKPHRRLGTSSAIFGGRVHFSDNNLPSISMLTDLLVMAFEDNLYRNEYVSLLRRANNEVLASTIEVVGFFLKSNIMTSNLVNDTVEHEVKEENIVISEAPKGVTTFLILTGIATMFILLGAVMVLWRARQPREDFMDDAQKAAVCRMKQIIESESSSKKSDVYRPRSLSEDDVSIRNMQQMIDSKRRSSQECTNREFSICNEEVFDDICRVSAQDHLTHEDPKLSYTIINRMRNTTKDSYFSTGNSNRLTQCNFYIPYDCDNDSSFIKNKIHCNTDISDLKTVSELSHISASSMKLSTPSTSTFSNSIYNSSFKENSIRRSFFHENSADSFSFCKKSRHSSSFYEPSQYANDSISTGILQSSIRTVAKKCQTNSAWKHRRNRNKLDKNLLALQINDPDFFPSGMALETSYMNTLHGLHTIEEEGGGDTENLEVFIKLPMSTDCPSEESDEYSVLSVSPKDVDQSLET